MGNGGPGTIKEKIIEIQDNGYCVLRAHFAGPAMRSVRVRRAPPECPSLSCVGRTHLAHPEKPLRETIFHFAMQSGSKTQIHKPSALQHLALISSSLRFLHVSASPR
jgi:hypothetical protein